MNSLRIPCERYVWNRSDVCGFPVLPHYYILHILHGNYYKSYVFCVYKIIIKIKKIVSLAQKHEYVTPCRIRRGIIMP